MEVPHFRMNDSHVFGGYSAARAYRLGFGAVTIACMEERPKKRRNPLLWLLAILPLFPPGAVRRIVARLRESALEGTRPPRDFVRYFAGWRYARVQRSRNRGFRSVPVSPR